MQIEPLKIYPQPPGCCDPCKDPASYPNYAKEARDSANAAAAASAAAMNYAELAEDTLDDFVNYAYSKAETDRLLDEKADAADLEEYYTKAETDALLTDYYDKSATDSLLAAKADASALNDYYTKSESDTLWATKANISDLNDYYTKTAADTLLAAKADVSDLDDYYTKTAADTLLAAKADASALNDYYTKSQSEAIDISNKFVRNSSLSVDMDLPHVMYDPAAKVVYGTITIMCASGQTVNTSTNYYTISDAAYRPAAQLSFGGMIRGSDRTTYSCQRIYIRADGGIRQNLTSTSTGIYFSFEYKV